MAIETNTSGWLFFDQKDELISKSDVIEFDLEEDWVRIKKRGADGNYEKEGNKIIRLRLYGGIKKEEEMKEEEEEEEMKIEEEEVKVIEENKVEENKIEI